MSEVSLTVWQIFLIKFLCMFSRTVCAMLGSVMFLKCSPKALILWANDADSWNWFLLLLSHYGIEAKPIGGYWLPNTNEYNYQRNSTCDLNVADLLMLNLSILCVNFCFAPFAIWWIMCSLPFLCKPKITNFTAFTACVCPLFCRFVR